MLPTRSGSLRLFQFSGIEVFLHWSWFIVGAFEINNRSDHYSSITWNILEYLSLFLIVLLHEFGHSLACRQVGGSANQIVLWPLGGVAFVSPPPRPGATLWSIAAGPLVNVVLFPLLVGGYWLARTSGWEQSNPDAFNYLTAVSVINGALLVFNMIPVYPLDGGQILRSLLWYVMGRGRSLLVSTLIGFVGGSALLGLAAWFGSIWIAIMAGFLLWQCSISFRQARVLTRLESAPRRLDSFCPACSQSPSIGAYWLCGRCRQPFDTFESGGVCPSCSTSFAQTMCLNCGALSQMADWMSRPKEPPLTPPPLPRESV